MAENTTINTTQTAASTVLAHAEEGRLRGISRSIIIGVGGTGHQILLDVRKRLVEKYGSLDKIPIVGFLQIDTDQALFGKNPDFDDAVNLDNADKIHTSVHGVDALRRTLKEHPHLRSWLDPRVLTGDIDQGAGAVRARGRLAYFWNYATIARRLEEEMLKVTRDSSKETAIHNGLQVGEGVTVYVVGSLLGGTGSGMFLDLAYTVRNKFKTQRMLEMVGMFSIPPNSEAVAVDNRPNAYAALLELNHFTDPSTTFSAQYQADIPPIEDADPPFRYCYLVDMSSPAAQLDSVKDLVGMIGHSIFLDLTSEFQRQKKSNRNNFDQFLITSDGLGCPQNYMGFGLSSLYFPKDKVIAACSSRLAGDIVRRWTVPLDRVVNVGAFTDQELNRLGMTPDAIQRLITSSQGDTGESLRDSAMGYWNAVNRQYESAYPGHNRVAEYLLSRQGESDAKHIDNDPNPGILDKRRVNLGEYSYQIQQNLANTIRAKETALREWVASRVNDPNHRHGAAAATLDMMADRFRSGIAMLTNVVDEHRTSTIPLANARDSAVQHINRHAGDVMMGLILSAKRTEIDKDKDAYLNASRRYDAEMIDLRGAAAAIVFYETMLQVVVGLRGEMSKFVERMESLQARFDKLERTAVQSPVDVNGEVLFQAGRRESDPTTGTDRYVGGDIDERYSHYVGSATDPNNATVNNLSADILTSLNANADIWGIRDTDLGRLESVFLEHTRAVFAAVEEESVLDKFYSKYGDDSDRTIQTVRRITSLSAPFLHLQENAPNYTHNMNKEQTIVGVMHGAAPRSESERRFLTMMMDTVQGVKDQQISNSNEQYQTLFLRERAAFPLRLLQGMNSYKYAYDQVKMQGAAANPIHTRTDVKEWIRIAPPSAEEQKSAWRTFVLGHASGVIAEEHETKFTSLGTRDEVRFVANYTDKFGMAKSDMLGTFNRIESNVVGVIPEALSPDRPPQVARDIIQKLCDDMRMRAQIDIAIEEKLRSMGPQLLGSLLVSKSNEQKSILPPAVYDPYYKVLTDYLEEIGFSGEGHATAPLSATPAVIGGTSIANGNHENSTVGAVASTNAVAKSVRERLEHLTELLTDGLVTQQEYDTRRREILSDI